MKINWQSTEPTSPYRAFMKAVMFIDKAHVLQHMEEEAEIVITVNGRDIAPNVLLAAISSSEIQSENEPDGYVNIRVKEVAAEMKRPFERHGGTLVVGTETFSIMYNMLVQMVHIKHRQLIEAEGRYREVVDRLQTNRTYIGSSVEYQRIHARLQEVVASIAGS